jgi:hypothetical protein
MDTDSQKHESAESESRPPLTPTVTGPAMPSSLDPVVTLGAIQRYVQSERERSRRMVLWLSTVFLMALVVVAVVMVLIGLVVIRNSRRAVEIAERVQAYAASHLAGLASVSNRIVNLETAHLQIRDEIQNWEEVRAKDTEGMRADMENVNRGIAAGHAEVSQVVSSIEMRLAGLEHSATEERQELQSVKSQYEQMLATASLPAAAEGGDQAAAPLPPAESLMPADEQPDAGMSLPSSPTGEVDLAALTNEAVFAVEEEAPVTPPEPPMEISVVTLPNGDRYEGQFKEGLFNGWGTYFYHNGDRYEGLFRDDMKNGRGGLVYQNGDRYVGAFTNDVRGGRGSLLFHDGDKYVGQFANDTISGKGVMLYRNGNRYAGDFLNGLKSGNGVFRYTNGDVYSGEFRDDLRDGKGVYVSHDGSRYIGDFKAGRRNGKGRYLYPTGEEYSGDFKDGRKDGFGICVYPGGKQVKGYWREDRFLRPSDD